MEPDLRRSFYSDQVGYASQMSCVFIVCLTTSRSSIQSLLGDPNPNSPANAEAARLFVDNKREYVDKVQDCVQKSWEEAV